MTGTYVHSAVDTLDLKIVGLPDPISCTAIHPFWSEDRKAFIAAGDIEGGRTPADG